MFSHLLLQRTATKLGVQWNSAKPVLISSVTIDSRLAVSQSLFFAFKGEQRDGHEFIPALLKKGVFCIGESDAYSHDNYIKVPSSLVFLQELSRERIRLKGKLKVIKGMTLYKGGDWWKAIVLIKDETFGEKYQLRFYGWKKINGEYRVKQKFNISASNYIGEILKILQAFAEDSGKEYVLYDIYDELNEKIPAAAHPPSKVS